VWLAPRTLKEATVTVAYGGVARRVVDEAGSTTDRLRAAVSSSTRNAAVTDETRVNFSPMR
jgi:hypothetical protein